MKNALPPILFCLLALVSCSENKTPVEPETQNTLARKAAFEYLDGSTNHKDKSFAAQWSVTKTVLKGGNRKESSSLTLDNGKLEITVIPTRGMGILDIRMGDLRLGWDSPVKEVVHPSHIDLESRGGLGWLRALTNGWCVAALNSPDTREPINSSTTPRNCHFDPHPPWQNPKHPGIRLPNQRRLRTSSQNSHQRNGLRKILLWSQTQTGHRNIHRPRF